MNRGQVTDTVAARNLLESTLAALGDNDSPQPNAGIMAMYQAEGLHQAVCPPDIYIANFRGGFRDPLIDHRSVHIHDHTLDTIDREVVFPVEVTAASGEIARYTF